MSSNRTSLNAPEDSKRPDQFHLEIDLMGSVYMSDPVDSEYQTNFYGDFRPRLDWAGDNFAVDLRGVVALNDEGDEHFYFPEVWYGWEYLNVGRKKEVWSQLDSTHRLGIWQPLFRWDHARPVDMGLTGFFLKTPRNSMIRLTAFASPLFLPDQQPDYKIEDGQMVSGNRWVRNPLSSIDFLNSPSNLNYYSINEPEIEDVIFNESYALKLEVGHEYGVWSSAAWAHKPANQFNIGIDISGIYDPTSNTFYPVIYPELSYHDLLTLEFGYRSSKMNFYFSVTQEEFDQPNFPEEYEQTPMMDSRYYGLVAEHEIDFPFRGRNVLRWSYLHKSELGIEEADTHIEGDVSASTERMRFKRWLGLDYIYSSAGAYLEDVDVTLGYRHSPVEKADWIAFSMNYGLDKNWSFYTNADLFGSENASEEASFISYYTNNDRVQLGMKYVY